MAETSLDYNTDEHLEQVFHSDLQNTEVAHEGPSNDGMAGDQMPEWLVGVIVVIVMLVAAIFAVIVTTLVKNRRKNRTSLYASHTACDDLESGKISPSNDSSMTMTSFTTVTDAVNDSMHLPQSVLVPRDQDHMTDNPDNATSIHGVLGCRNPLFVDDEAGSDDYVNFNGTHLKTRVKEHEDKKQASDSENNRCNPSTSGRDLWDDAAGHRRSKSSSNKNKLNSATKMSVKATEMAELGEMGLVSGYDGDVGQWILPSKTGSKVEQVKAVTSMDNVMSGEESEKEGELPEATAHLDLNKGYMYEHSPCHDEEGEIHELETQRDDDKVCLYEQSPCRIQGGHAIDFYEDSVVDLDFVKCSLKVDTGSGSQLEDTASEFSRKSAEGTKMESTISAKTDSLNSGDTKRVGSGTLSLLEANDIRDSSESDDVTPLNFGTDFREQRESQALGKNNSSSLDHLLDDSPTTDILQHENKVLRYEGDLTTADILQHENKVLRYEGDLTTADILQHENKMLRYEGDLTTADILQHENKVLGYEGDLTTADIQLDGATGTMTARTRGNEADIIHSKSCSPNLTRTETDYRMSNNSGGIDVSHTLTPSASCGMSTSDVSHTLTPSATCGMSSSDVNNTLTPSATCGMLSSDVSNTLTPSATCGMSTSDISHTLTPSATCGMSSSDVNNTLTPSATCGMLSSDVSHTLTPSATCVMSSSDVSHTLTPSATYVMSSSETEHTSLSKQEWEDLTNDFSINL